MKLTKSSAATEKLEMDMTPMIDVCFQLLIFFMLSLRLFSPEGDFNIRMPIAAPSEGPPDPTQLPPLKIRITAHGDGSVSGIRLGEKQLRSFTELQKEIFGIVGDDRGPGSVASKTEVDLDCDYSLRFEYVIDAMTAVSGYVDPGSRTIVQVIEKIKFTPRPKE